MTTEKQISNGVEKLKSRFDVKTGMMPTHSKLASHRIKNLKHIFALKYLIECRLINADALKNVMLKEIDTLIDLQKQ